MKNNVLILTVSLLFTAFVAQAQDTLRLTLPQAVDRALKNSAAANLTAAKLKSAEHELKVAKNARYPDASISAQYLYLTNANTDLQTQSSGEPRPSLNVDQLVLGQAKVSMPLFSGFKLKNVIEASENQYKAASFTAQNEMEQLALETINNYISLYKATQSITLIEENLKSAQQRVKDFEAKEQNGLLARNDLLKAQLQQSNIEVTLEEAKKNQLILNYKLAMSLNLDEQTVISTGPTDFNIIETTALPHSIDRSDLNALKYHKLATENQIKIAKSNYYPSFALTGGYLVLDIHNVLTVTNAMNFGIGLSYNLSDIFKTKSNIALAKSRVQEMQFTLDAYSDQVKIQVESAEQEYDLALKKYTVFTKSQEQAIENYRIVKDKYENGLADTNDLLEADVEQLQAKINLTYAKANITQRYYELLTAEGQLTKSLNN
ncbi:MAG TPA: TolC family protein [Fulvivirga sp.]|nr:TolC family protein [Fulvivirga sp.]